jgi:hypothetical protein
MPLVSVGGNIRFHRALETAVNTVSLVLVATLKGSSAFCFELFLLVIRISPVFFLPYPMA